MKQRKSAQPMTISRISRPMTPANAATVMVVEFEPFCVVVVEFALSCVVTSDSELVTTGIGSGMDRKSETLLM